MVEGDEDGKSRRW
jgi:hypothetical protein